MARSFVSSFLLPLVNGGRLHVGRPLGQRDVERLGRLASERGGEAAEALAQGRLAVASRFLRDVAPPPLDQTTLRLGAAVHDLLVLVHPGLEGPRVARRLDRVAATARALAEVGAPRTAVEAVNRHSLLARLPEIGRTDSTVSFWLGRQTFVGRVPPARVTALPALRRVRVEAVKRLWLREIGVPSVAREAVLALGVASPLGEALDPLRLDPPLFWSRILPVMRAPQLARIVAGRMLEIGLERAGDGLASALLRFASFQDPPGGVAATPEAVAFAIGFLAHLVWLDVLFGESEGGAGGELGVMMAAAAALAPTLVWPPDVPPDGDLGRAYAHRLARYEESARGAPTTEAAAGVVAFASSAARGAPSSPGMARDVYDGGL
jgi:hypothetical protein